MPKNMLHLILQHPRFSVTVLFLIAELVINPIGEFPLNDDWAYAKSMQSFLQSGKIHFSFWQAIPGLSQFFTGILFCKIFGFSFTLLRLISVFCQIIMIALFDGNLKYFGIDASKRVIILLLFVFNPLTISLSNSFLPDIFQLFLGLIAFHFMLMFIKTDKIYYYLFFIAFCLFATLNRQTGMAIPLTFGIIFFISSNKSLKKISLALFPFIVSLFGVITFEQLAKSRNILPANYGLQLNNIFQFVTDPSFDKIKVFGYYFITSTLCLGLFILPLTVSNLKFHLQKIRESLILKCIFGAYMALITIKVIYSGNPLPFVGNMLYHAGIGPVILTGFNTEELLQLSTASKVAWIILNFIGGISFFISITSIVNGLPGIKQSKTKLSGYFFIFLSALYLLPVCVSYANDRYLLFLLPFYFLAYFLSGGIKINNRLFVICFLPLFYFSVAGTHDYMAMNKARKQATDHLTKDLKITPDRIDGGFEFNGWHLAGTKNYIPSHAGRWWWIDKDDYIVTPVKLPDYSIESEYYFSSWISFSFDKIYVLKK